MRKFYQLLLLAAVVFVVYFPAQFAGFSPIDDQATFDNLREVGKVHLVDVFIPSGSVVGYYRPILFISYFADKYLFGLAPAFMHLENILFHFINALLVFFIVQEVMPRQERRIPYAPLVASLLFAVHPLTTESVNWISGRTDILACNFVLASTLFLLKYRESGLVRYLAFSTVAFLCGALTKEFVVAYLPAAVVILAAGDESGLQSTRAAPLVSFLRKFRDHVLFVMVVFACASGIALMNPHFLTLPRRLQLTMMAVGASPFHSLLVVITALGFYVKKALIPYPLNFAILEVDSLYVLLGVPSLICFIYFSTRRSLPAAFLASGLLLLTPSLVIVFGQIAWTPYAERYLYLPLAFFIMASVLSAARGFEFIDASYLKMAAAVLLVLFSITSLQRSFVWQNPISLAEDTVSKSPRSLDMRIVYGNLLAKRGDFTRALEQISIARQIPAVDYNDKADMMMAHVLDMMGNRDEALKVATEAWERSKGKSMIALQNMILLTTDKIEAADSPFEKHLLVENLLNYSEVLFQMSRDPKVLYRAAVQAQETGDRRKARVAFLQALSAMSADDVYRKAAQKRLLALER